MDIKSFASAIDQIAEEKGIPKEKIIETIELALAAAYKKEYDRKGQNIVTKLELETGDMKVYQIKTVVDESIIKSEEEIEAERKAAEEKGEEETGNEELGTDDGEGEKKIRFNPEKHIMINEVDDLPTKIKSLSAGKAGKKKKFEVGDEIKFPLEVARDFGRIAAQTAKQVIIQRIREAERESIYDEYKEKEGQVLSGIIQRIERGNVFLDIGKATGVLFPEDQIPNENYRIGQRLRVYIAEVQKDSRGPAITLSRTHPKMVSQLFAIEVPEIAADTVEIKAIAREAGSRSKIAVSTNEDRVDPIGSMIGQKGTRVQAVINELSGEKIDIIEYSDDPAKFISSALSPAKVNEVSIDKEKNQATVVVPEDQLSLAIGVKGQNVRLAAKLTGWKIDIIIKETGKKAAAKKTDDKDSAAEKEKPKKKKAAAKKQAEEKTKTKKILKTKSEVKKELKKEVKSAKKKQAKE